MAAERECGSTVRAWAEGRETHCVTLGKLLLHLSLFLSYKWVYSYLFSLTPRVTVTRWASAQPYLQPFKLQGQCWLLCTTSPTPHLSWHHPSSTSIWPRTWHTGQQCENGCHFTKQGQRGPEKKIRLRPSLSFLLGLKPELSSRTTH